MQTGILSACTFPVGAHTHTFGEWTVTKEATCTEEGTQERECTLCHEKKTKPVAAKGHSYGEWDIVTEATCTGKDEKTYTCTASGATRTEEFPALGHYISEIWESDANSHWHNCSVCGELIDKAEHSFDENKVCRVCGYKIS